MFLIHIQSTTKTSILLFDKKIRNNINGVFFIKVNNDGFELGSERKPIDENDLPTALEIVNNLRKDKTEFPKADTLSFTILTREEIEARIGYNLAVLNDVEEIEDENYDNIEIGKILKPIKKAVKLDDTVIYKQVTVKMNGKGVVLRQEIKGDKIKTKSQFLAEEGNFIMSKIDARNGAFGIVPKELNGAIVTQDFPLFKVNNEVMLPEFLNVVIQSPQFIKICQTTSVGTSNRRRLKVDKFLKSRIPLPNIEEQRNFLERINYLNSKIDTLNMQIESLNAQMRNEILNVWGVKEEIETV